MVEPKLPTQRTARGAVLSIVLGATLCMPVYAQAQTQTPTQDPLTQADDAYRNVDFESVARFAQQALERGGNDRRRLGRIYQLLGIARAALGNSDASRDAYIRMLAFDPESRVDRTLSPQLRGPFLEARGYWNDRSERLTLDVRRVDNDASLEVSVTDPLSLGRFVVLRARLGRSGAFIERRVPATARQTLALPDGASRTHVEYSVAVLDQYNNRVLEQGTDEAPQRFDPASANTSGNNGGSSAQGSATLTILGGTGIGLGVAFLTLGFVGVGLRENAAARWNDDSRCLDVTNPSATRGDVCAGELSTIRTMEVLQGVGFVGGGLLAIGGVIALAIAPRGASRAEGAPRASATRWIPGPGLLGAGLELRF